MATAKAVFDEYARTLLAPPDLSAAEEAAARAVTNRAGFRRLLRRAVRRAVRRVPALARFAVRVG